MYPPWPGLVLVQLGDVPGRVDLLSLFLFVKQDFWFFASFDLSKNLGALCFQPLTGKEKVERFHSIVF